MARLGDYIKQVRGVSYKPEDVCDSSTIDSVPILRANNIQDNGLNFHDLVYVKKARVSKEQMIKAGDIVICTSSGSKNLVGKAAVAKEDLQISFGAFCKVVRTSRMSAEYLGYFFQSPAYRSRIAEVAGGANINNIRNEHIDDLSFPLINQEKQNEAIAVLDKVTDLISLRKQQIAKLDELVKSQFIEMFGDMETNSMGWEFGTVRDVVSEVKYGTSRPAVEDGKYKYLRMNNITYDGQLDLSDLKRINIPDNEVEKCVAQKGDVLFNRTNSKELVGKTCVFNLDEPMIIAGYIIRVRVNDRILPEFLSAVLNSNYGKRTLFDLCKAAIGQANINAQELQDIRVIIPPIELQNEFVKLLQQVDKSKFEIQKSLEKLETLKKALMQQYFG